MASNTKLHWAQRVALIRYNLHAASRSGDFSFFKAIQAQGFIEGTNHVAALSAELGDEADILLAALDNLNAGLAYVHQDAFNNVYETLKEHARAEDGKTDESKLYVDITMQKNMADMAIDKMSSSALALINQQPASVQELTANVWITGTTLVADSMEVALQELDDLENKLDDFIRLEESWSTVKASVVCAVTGLKGVFRLMDPNTSPCESEKSSPRNSSIVSASGAVFRKLSSAFAGPSTHSRSSSISSTMPSVPVGTRANSISSMGPVYRTPNYMRNSVSAGCPTSLPSNVVASDFEAHKLSMIPPTPAAMADEQPDPFDNSVPPMPQLPIIPLPALTMQAKRLSQAVI